MKSNQFEYLDELVKFLFFQFKKKEMPLSEFRTQKAIFKIKMDLGENHPLYGSIHYYWYFYGPFSEFVRDSYSTYENNLDYSHKLKEDIYKKWENKEFEIVNKYPELIDSIENLVKDRNYFYEYLHKDIYKKFGPYDCLYSFKFEIFDTADKQRNLSQIGGNGFIKTLYEIEATLPNDNYFIEFSDIYSRFITELDLLNDKGELIQYWQFLREPIKKAWHTFAKGLRVKNKDEAYKQEEKSWDFDFKANIKFLKYLIKETEENIQLTSSKSVFHEYSPLGKKILKSTIGNYIEE